MSNSIPYKPKKNHPWKNCASSAAVSWARKESHIRNVSNVSVARNETLKRKDKDIQY